MIIIMTVGMTGGVIMTAAGITDGWRATGQLSTDPEMFATKAE